MSSVRMDDQQERALTRLLRAQFGALDESESGAPREEALFLSEDLERLEPLLHFLEAAGGSGKGGLSLYFSKEALT